MEEKQKQLEATDIQEIRLAFDSIDQDGDGFINLEELKVAFRKINLPYTDEEVEGMITHCDTDNDSLIDFPEFLALCASNFDDEEEMKEMFNVFDKEGKGYIERIDLESVLKRIYPDVEDNEIDEMMREFDFNSDGQIEFEDFCKVMV